MKRKNLKTEARKIVDDALDMIGIGEHPERFMLSRLDFVNKIETLANNNKVL